MSMRATLRFPSLPALLIAFASAAGQTPVKPYFSGTVVDALRGHPLAGVEITVPIPNAGALETTHTDEQGRFVISEATYFRAIGMPMATRPMSSASPSLSGEGSSHRADGRAPLPLHQGRICMPGQPHADSRPELQHQERRPGTRL